MCVNLQTKLRCILLAIGTHRDQAWILTQLFQQLITRFHQRVMPQIAAVLKHQVESGGIAQLRHRRRREGHYQSVPDSRKSLPGTRSYLGNREGFITALVPGSQLDERQTDVLAAARKAETGHSENTRNRIFLVHHKMLLDLTKHFVGSFFRGTWRKLDQRKQGPLIFVGKKAHRQLAEAQHHQQDDDPIADHVTPGSDKHVADDPLIPVATAIKGPVEPAEEPATFLSVVDADRLEQCCAERRRQDHRNQHRERHGRHDGDRELPVNNT